MFLGTLLGIYGVILGVIFAIHRAVKGDWWGALLELASGLAGGLLPPGIGMGLTMAIEMGLQYKDFKNCFGGNWWVYTHSLYNDSGCFTIHCLPQRGEVDCYFTEILDYNYPDFYFYVNDLEENYYIDYAKRFFKELEICDNAYIVRYALKTTLDEAGDKYIENEEILKDKIKEKFKKEEGDF